MTARIARIAESRVVAVRQRIAATLDAVPGVRAEPVEGGVAVRGRRLRARFLSDPRLRWLGGWM